MSCSRKVEVSHSSGFVAREFCDGTGYEERRKIARWRSARLSVDVIAEKLGHRRLTNFRGLKLTKFVDEEFSGPNVAHDDARAI